MIIYIQLKNKGEMIVRANEIYAKNRKKREKFYKKYENFDDLFTEIIQSEVKFYGSIKKIPFDMIAKTGKIADEYNWITNGACRTKNFEECIVNAFKGICWSSDFDRLENIEHYKKLIKLSLEMTKEIFKGAEFKYIYNSYYNDVVVEVTFKTFWEKASYKYTLEEVKEVISSYEEVLFINETVKFVRENRDVDFKTLFLKVVSITEEKEEGEVKVEWELSKKGEIYRGTLDIPGSLDDLRKGKKLHLYSKEVSYKDYLKESKGKIKVNSYYGGFPKHVAKWVKAQILNGKAMNAIQ